MGWDTAVLLTMQLSPTLLTGHQALRLNPLRACLPLVGWDTAVLLTMHLLLHTTSTVTIVVDLSSEGANVDAGEE